MSDSYTNLLYHIVFSTKNRQPSITADYELRLLRLHRRNNSRAGRHFLTLNGTEDHIHLLAKLRPDRALSDVLRKLKANASGWMHRVFPRLEDFTWQRGYGAFTVSQSSVPEVTRYIARQKEHHQKTSFREVLIKFLIANQIEFDKRYI